MRVDRKRIRRYQCVWEKPHGPKRLARQGNCCSGPTRWRTAPPLAEPPYTKCWPPESCLYSEQGAVYGFRLRSWNTGSKTMAPRLFPSEYAQFLTERKRRESVNASAPTDPH